MDIPKRLSFVHIPKNAGTSVENVGQNHGIRWGKNEMETSDSDYTYRCPPWHDPMEIEQHYSSLGETKTFCIVRNPYDRIRSEYEYRTRKTPTKRYAVDLNNFVQTKIEKYHTQHSNILDCHIIPQIYYTPFCDHILRYENLETDFSNLMQNYNYPDITLDQHKNRSTQSSITIHDLDSKSVQIINNHFREDFETFNYNMK